MSQGEARLNGKWRSLAEIGVCWPVFSRWRRCGFVQYNKHWIWHRKGGKGRPMVLVDTEIVTPEWIKEHKYFKPDHLSPTELENIVKALGFVPEYLHAECERAGIV